MTLEAHKLHNSALNDVKLLNDRFTNEIQCFGSSTIYHRDIDQKPKDAWQL